MICLHITRRIRYNVTHRLVYVKVSINFIFLAMKNDKVNMKEILSIMEGILSMHEQLIKNQHKLIERIDHLDNHVYIMSDRMLALQTKCDKLLEDRNMAIIKGDDVVDIDVYRNNVRRLIDADVEAKAEEEVKKEYGGMPGFGGCHLVWMKMQEIYLKEYGIKWLSPAEEAPEICFD